MFLDFLSFAVLLLFLLFWDLGFYRFGVFSFLSLELTFHLAVLCLSVQCVWVPFVGCYVPDIDM